MSEKRPPERAAPKAETREDRLKSALRANLARRKAQARARAAGEGDVEAETDTENKG